ncbi:Uncharacterised protein [Salmonella enterica subsp. enterica serovar Bovismorbificans]|uniref:Uncharacterized protein n=2 Tax=Salmonella enterica I TaxID=59201 RepID=A0A655C219_SALET|nr:hypothetical protein LTSEALA_5769 [Salmonella enterica subsp. enterica serovar Alachua str. R6-377]CAH2836118.1 hypothetical protein SEN1169SA97_31050 [Salmonella enterica subsp. enterica serovar Agona]CAI9425516.1 hypothetical protein LA5775_40910 [Salmonella enterica subsp. enterica serovar Enteritidis]CFW74574.1 Uncharacterised protein [Salmonella enterica subsp. enterica serovar Bovismorbificans]CNT71284.1 Uncharacterised protein [Salmonella enterica subsp. enterica serovar Bovismorbific
MLGQRERVARPASVIKGNRVGMAGQQQTARAMSGAGEHIKFVSRSWNRLNLYVETKIAEPACKQSD